MGNHTLSPIPVIDNDSKYNKIKGALKSKPARITGKVFNGAYTFFVSAMFAAFAYRRGGKNIPLSFFFAASSFAVNAPMAWNFSEVTVDTFTRAFEKKERAFVSSFLVGLVLAAFTTGAGLKVAREQVDGLEEISFTSWVSNIPGLEEVLAGMSALNTFMTRFVGSVYILYAAWQFAKSFVRRRQEASAAHYQFLDDLTLYGHRVNVQLKRDSYLSNDEYLKAYAQNFYAELAKQGIQPGQTWGYAVKDAAIFIVTTALAVTFILNMTPLWIRLTVKGVDTLSSGLADSPVFVFLAAVSNQLFYFNSNRQFLENVIDVSAFSYAFAKQKLGGDTKKTMFGALALVSIGFIAWAIFSEASGTGYGEDALEAVQKGFGDMANQLWFSWMGWYTGPFLSETLYSDVIATTSAGLIVNGGAFLRFLLSFKKEPESTALFGPDATKSMLVESIEAGEFDQQLSETIHFRREAAKPQKSVIESCASLWRRCRGGEYQPLVDQKKLQDYSVQDFV